MERNGDPRMNLSEQEEDLRRQRAARDDLQKHVAQMKVAAKHLEEQLEAAQTEDSFWKSRYLEQKGINKQLEQQVAQLEKDTAQLARKEAAGGNSSDHPSAKHSEIYMRHMLRQLLREKNELERVLRDHEWRLDNEAMGINRAQQEKVAMTTEIAEATLLILERQKKQRDSQEGTKEEQD